MPYPHPRVGRPAGCSLDRKSRSGSRSSQPPAAPHARDPREVTLRPCSAARRYGGLKTVRALETPGGDDDRQWLTYWLILAFLTTLEYSARVLLSWVPHYYEAKLLFLIWLMLAGVSHG